MRPILLLTLCLLLAACAVPLRTENVGADRVYLSVNANALSHMEPSFPTRTALHRADLIEAYDHDPRAAPATLHREALRIDRRDRLFALSELCLLTARDEEDRDLNLAAAVYAFLFLLGDAETPPPDGFSRRFRLACEIYNRALAEAFRMDDGRWYPVAGVYDLPVGQLIVDLPDDRLRIGQQGFGEFRLSADYEVHGLTARLHQAGLGAALIAGAPKQKTSAPNEISPGVLIPGTAFLDVRGELEDAEGSGILCELTLTSPKTITTKQVRGRTIPLEVDTTTPLAYSLADSKWWEFELSGFLSPDKVEISNGLTLLSPYVPGRIPVVFVHGTASSPARWAEMINELAYDPVLASRYTVWLFTYKTSAPVLKSARTLRDAITDRISRIDPDGADEALRRIVVVGHSQGGLLTRLMVTHSGDHFWKSVSNRSFEELEASPDEKDVLRRTLFFEPLPEIQSVVFIATPHRGSFLSEGIFRSIANTFISIPKRTLRASQNLLARNVGLLRPDVLGASPTAVDNMAPGNRFLVALEAAPMSSRVDKHSIIAVTDPEAPVEDRDDGVVAFTSAQIDAVDSEVVVRSGHSVQNNERCIDEVRRILREHLLKPPRPRTGE